MVNEPVVRPVATHAAIELAANAEQPVLLAVPTNTQNVRL